MASGVGVDISLGWLELSVG